MTPSTTTRRWLRLTVVAALASTLGSAALAADCGRVTIANMNWQSAEVLANIDQFVLKKGYGCDAELVPGDTMPTLTSMIEKGQPDVAPEAWVNSIREPLDKAVKAGKLHYTVAALSDGGIEGIWIPKYLADAHPDIKTVGDALKHPELFPASDDPKMGALYNCPSGWSCQITTGNLYKAIKGKDKNFKLVDSGSAAGLDGAIAKAYERKQGWLGYYWGPTAMLGKYAMVQLKVDSPFDKVAWDACNAKGDCANPKLNPWPKADVNTVVTERFRKQAGPAYDYLSKRQWDNTTVNGLLAWMKDNQADGKDGALHFLETRADLWTTWVSPAVAAKIKAAL
jgi:glycine betaine/proline transport system substrate-binding protein